MMSSTRTFLLLLRLLVVLDFSALVHSSHFRGGIIQWRPASLSNYNGQIEFTHRIAWRRSSGGNNCDSTTITSRTLVGGGSLQCTVGCSGSLGSLEYYCTDFSSVEDWTSGERTYTYNMGTATYFEASFTGCCWINLNEGGAGWAVVVKGQLTPRSDNGLINSSPVSATMPIVRLQYGCSNRVINIPVQDADGDVIRCRWAVGSECAGICQSFSPGTLSGCSLTYNGGGSVGLYAVALQIEDFIDSTSTTPLSSVPLQFIVELFSSSQPCLGTRPTLVGETPPDDSCIPVPFGTTYHISVVAMVGHSSVSIVEFPTVSPLGVQKSAVGQSVYSSLLYYTNITWTPQASQYGLNILCYSARDSNSQNSDQYCITLLGGVQGPMALQNMTSPTGAILGTGSNIIFSIGFDQEIGRPTRNTYIRIYENSGLQVLTVNTASSNVIFPASGSGGRVLSFTTSYSFQSADGYYILLDAGAAVGTAFCDQESISVTDTNFWRFSTSADECALGVDDCSQNASCTDTASSYYCTCYPGYSGDGRSCFDINECLSSTVCPLYSTCTNTVGNFSCSCIFGTDSDGVSCIVPTDPGPPTSVLLTNIGTTSATVTWTAPSYQSNNRITYFVLILADLKFGFPSINITVSSTTLSYTFTGLEEFGSYGCDVLSVSEYGLFSIAISTTINTLASAPVVSPISPGGVAITSSLIRLLWTKPPEIDINGAILFYLVELREVPTGINFTFHAVDVQIVVGPLHAYYEYVCRVAIFTTALGPFTNYFSVFSGEAVPSAPPQNLSVTITTSSAIALSWNPPPTDQQNGIIRYYIVYITEIGESGNTFELQTNGSNTVFTIENLLPIYTYSISLAAYTIRAGPATATSSVKIPESAPSAPPVNLNGFAIDHTSVYFEWESPPLNQQNGFIVLYVLNVTERETGLKFQRFTNQTSITLLLLHPDYIYECRVSAVTVAEGPFSAIFAIRLLVAAPSGPPENVVTVFPDPYSIVVDWDPPAPEDRNGPIIGYVINVTVVRTGEFLQFFSNVSRFSLTSLQPFTTFICVFAAQTPVGTGPFSRQYIVTTPEDISSPPLSPTVTVPPDPYSLYIMWAQPEILNGIISQYTVYCAESSTSSGDGPLSPDTEFGSNFVSASTNSTSLILTGLRPYTQYNCFVSASTSAGESEFSIVVSAATEQSVPDDPPSFMNAVTTAFNVVLSWDEPQIPNGIIVSYTLSYNITSGNFSTVIDVLTGRMHTLSGLDAYTYYEVTITAETKVGSGPATSIVVRTSESSPDSPPMNILTSVLSSTTVSTTWVSPSLADRNGQIVFFILVLKDVQFNTSTVMGNTSNFSYTFTGLHEYTQYTLEIAAATSAGLGPFGSPTTFVTQEDVPTAPPQLVSGISRSSTLITFSWSSPPPLEVNGLLRYSIVRVTERHTRRSWTFFAVDNDIHIGSLHPYYYYDCVVAAHTIDTGPFSQSVSVRTDQAAPTAPPEQLSTIISSRSLTLMWSPPPFEETNGVIQYYSLSITEFESGQVLTMISLSVVAVINDLHPYYTYECTVAAYTVGLGPYSSSVTILLNEEAPSQAPTNVIGLANSSEVISISWNPPPFEHQNGMIHSYKLNVTEVETGIVTMHTTFTTATTLFSLHPYYTYEIRVSAVTVATGPYSQSISIRTNPDVPSSPVQNPIISGHTSNSVSLTWSAPAPEDRNGPIIEYKITVTVISTGQTYVLTSSTTNLEVTSLRPFTDYIFRIAAVTAVGIGPYSTTLSITTLSAAPESPPEDVVLSSVSSTSILVSWSPPPAELQNGVITQYRIYVTEVDTGNQLMYSTMITSIAIQLLHPFYTYECVVSTYTVAEGPYSAVLNVTTPQDVPDGYPQNFTAVATTSRSAVLIWDPPSKEVQNGIIVNYTIDISVAGSSQTFQVYSTTAGTTLSTLQPYRTYFCIVSALTVVGRGPPSTVLTLSTPEDAPNGSPNIENFYAQDSTTIVLSWSPPDEEVQNGVIREYRIQLEEIDTGNISLYISLSTSIEISLLHPDSTYELSVAAFTIAIGPYSVIVNVTTSEDVPSGPPQNINSASVTSTSILLTWELPLQEDQNGEITGYSVSFTSLDSSDTSVVTVYDSEELELTELRPFTTYTIVIAAETTIGIGPYSKVFHVQTLEDAPTHPANLNGSSINATHIFLQWDPPPENATNGIIREYRINITERLTGIVTQYTTDPDIRELIVGSLHPFYTYQCVIVAHTIEPGPFTEAIVVQTDEAAPSGPPRNISLSVQNSQSIYISWDPPSPSLQNGILRQYSVTLTSSFSVDTHTISSSSTFFVITGLRPYTNYTCSVRAITTDLGPAITAQVQTPEDVPTGAPLFVSSQALSPSVLFIQWEPPNMEQQNGVIRRYVINITEIETTTSNMFYSNETNITLDSRHPFYQYSYSVSAVTFRPGPFSSIDVIQMPEAAPLQPPTGMSVFNVTSTSFQIIWNNPPPEAHNGVIRNYQVTLTNENTGFSLISTQKTSLLFDNLSPNTVYSYQLRAVTVSPGPLSAIETVNTLEDVPSDVPQNFTVQIISSTTILLSWLPPPPESRNGQILGFIVTITQDGNGPTMAIPVENNEHEVLVNNLLQFTTYTCSILAFTAIGNGPTSQTVMLTTLEDAPSGAPSFPTVVGLTSTSVSLNWLPPNDALHNGVIRHYLIYLQETNTGANFSVQTLSDTRFTVGDLHPYYTYVIFVQAVTVLPGPLSSPTTILTLQDVPAGAPINIEAIPMDSRNLQIQWNQPPPEMHNGIIVDYTVNISEIETGTILQFSSGGVTTVSIPGLHPFYSYTYVVAALTEIGQGPHSTSSTIRMPEDVPSSYPLALIGETVNSSAILLSWQHPESQGRNGIIISYAVMLRDLSTSQVLEYFRVGTHIDILITSLHPYYEYECTVAAATALGRGPFAPVVTIRTEEDAPSGPPLTVVATAISSNAIYLTWQPPSEENVNGIIRMYFIVVVDTVTGETLTLNTTATFITVNSLHPFYTYTLSVAAFTTGTGPLAEVSITLPEDVPTGVPVNVDAVSVSSTSIRISWEPPPLDQQNGIIVAYFVSVTEIETGVVHTFNTDVTDNLLIVNSLHPFYNYNCSVATFTIGLGPAIFVAVQALPEEPSDVPQNVTISALSPTSALVSWFPPPMEHQNGIIIGFIVRVSGVNTEEVIERTVTQLSNEVSGLHPFYLYRFSVAAETIAPGPFSNPITLQLPESAPSAAVENLTLTNALATSVTIGWYPASPYHWNGILVQYVIEYQLIRSIDSSSEVVEPVLSQSIPSIGQPLANEQNPIRVNSPLLMETAQLDGLEEYFVYSISIYFETSAGRSLSSSSIMIETLPSAPSGPPTLVKAVASSTSVRIEWMPPDARSRNGVIAGYTVDLTNLETMEQLTYNVDMLIFQVEGLPSFTDFNVRVSARTDSGQGPHSDLVYVKTSENVPGAPSSVEIKVENSTAVLITWMKPEKPNGYILEYQVVYYGFKPNVKVSSEISVIDGPHTVTLKNETNTSVVISGLQSGLTYEFLVRARTNVGYGAYSTAARAEIFPAVTATTSSNTTVIVVAVLGWVFLVIIVIVIITVYIRSKSHSGKFNVWSDTRPNGMEFSNVQATGIVEWTGDRVDDPEEVKEDELDDVYPEKHD